MFLCAYRCMAAVQGRALIFTVLCIYTHIQVVSTRALPSLPAAPECAQTELHRLSSLTGFFHSPQVRHGRNQRESHQFVPPKTGACHHSCIKSWENGQSSSTTLKKPQPSKQTNKRICKIKTKKPPPLLHILRNVYYS